MRAVSIKEFTQPDRITVEEILDPIPGPNEVLVEIRATAANFVDLLVITGKYQFLPPRPFVPGKLPTGVVTTVGSKVSKLKVGDRVLTLAESGGYAEKIAVPEKDCFVLPGSLSFVDAASMALAFDTAWFALCERGRAKAGETVLVLGASGAVGLAAVQLAKAYGLRVLAGIADRTRDALVLDAGADHIIDLSAPDLRENLREQVQTVTDGVGADIVLDQLGGDFFDAAIRAVAWRGRVVVVGFAAGRIPTLKVNYVMLKNMEVSGIQVSDYRKRAPDEMSHCISEIFRLYIEGRIRAAPSVTYPLDEAPQALRALSTRSQKARIILTNDKQEI
jgi:NADPH2:quinone reductase